MTADLLRRAADLLDDVVDDEGLPASPWAYHAEGSMVYHGGNGRTATEMLAEVDRLNAESAAAADGEDVDWSEFDEHFRGLHNCDIDPPLGRLLQAMQPATCAALAVWLRAEADHIEAMSAAGRAPFLAGCADTVARAVLGDVR